MSDDFFDAARANGTYPRKGYGWQSEQAQREEIARRLAAGERQPWVLEEARMFRIEVPHGEPQGDVATATRPTTDWWR